MVFQVSPDNFEPKTCSYYDAYCYSDPRLDVEYMDYFDWLKIMNEKRMLDMRRSSSYNRDWR
jgi:hypothetical protein